MGTATHQAARAADAARQPPRALLWTFWAPVAILCGLALLLRLAILEEFLRENPLAECPRVDAAIYWQMAGRMARGQWTDSTPFLCAPLYPYLLGVIRALGGELRTVYVVQLSLHLTAGVLIAWVTKLRFGPLAGILAAALFFALTEPAISCTRVLASTLQLLLVVLVWWRWIMLGERGCRWRDVLAGGALVGLLALAFPPAVLLVPLYGLSAWCWGKWRRSAVGKAAVGIVVALLVISPATLHNLLIHGELIPITAHSGITLRQGNSPDARGNIAPIPGISPQRTRMHEDAARQFQRIHGRPGSWREIDRHFRREAIDYWLENPLSTLKLFARKLYFYLTVRNYDDIMSTAIEREAGFADRASLAPLATPWLMGAALVGLIATLRRPARYAPEWILALLPLVVVLLFFYTPRYRLPAVPLLCALSAYAVTHCRRFRVPTVAVIAVFLLPLPLYVRNAVTGIDSPDRIRSHFFQELSEAQVQAGDRRAAANAYGRAERRYRSALELWQGNFLARERLGMVYLRQRRVADAIREFSEAIRLNPNGLSPRLRLYNALCAQGRYAEAAKSLRQVTRLSPQNVEAHLALAWLLATCPDEQVRDGNEALRHVQTARRLTHPERHDVLDVSAAAYAELGQFEQAQEVASAAVDQARQRGLWKPAEEISQRLAAYRNGRPWRARPAPLGPDSSP